MQWRGVNWISPDSDDSVVGLLSEAWPDLLGCRAFAGHPTLATMFADTLLRAEQLHLFRLLVWGGGSIIVGTLMFVILAWRRPSTTMLRHFGVQMVVWGVIELAYVFWAWHGLGLRDVSGATRLDRMLWLNLGLDLGAVGIGASIAILGWLNGKRLGLLGSGVGIVIQAAVIFLINVQLAASISR